MQTDHAVIRNVTVRLRTSDENVKKVAVYVSRGQLIIEECSITSNSLSSIKVAGSTANAIIRNCLIFNGTANGILFDDRARGTVEDSDIYNNSFNGIEIRNGANTTIQRCSINENKGAGVSVHKNALGSVLNSNLTDNKFGAFYIESGSQVYRSENTED
jgi:parallel beta-helix repeat protein